MFGNQSTGNKEEVTAFIPTIKKPEIKNYLFMFDEMKRYFGTLSPTKTDGKFFSFSIKVETISPDVIVGVYYGKTKFTGASNRNGKREIAFLDAKGQVICKNERSRWSEYERVIGKDNMNWYGYFDTDLMHIKVYENIEETELTSWLSYVGNSINDAEYSELIYNEVKKLNLMNGEFVYKKTQAYDYGDDAYNFDLPFLGKYKVAGLFRYVTAPFVCFGFARKEENNSYNSKAIAIYTTNNMKIGYIAENELDAFYQETNGNDTPIVIEGHLYNGKLYGNLFTFLNNVKEYPYMIKEYIYCYEHGFEKTEPVNKEIKIMSETNIVHSNDPLLKNAAQAILLNQDTSAAMLQRQFNIGFVRAEQIIDQLESLDIVSPAINGKNREILIHDEKTLASIIGKTE